MTVAHRRALRTWQNLQWHGKRGLNMLESWLCGDSLCLRPCRSTGAQPESCTERPHDRLNQTESSLLRFGELGHITETHYAATQILSPCKGGFHAGQQFRESVITYVRKRTRQLRELLAPFRDKHVQSEIGSGMAMRVKLSDLTGSFDATQRRKADVQKNQIRL